MNQMQWADGCGGGVAPEAADSRLHTAFAFIGREGRGSARVGIIQPKADRFLSARNKKADGVTHRLENLRQRVPVNRQ